MTIIKFAYLIVQPINHELDYHFSNLDAFYDLKFMGDVLLFQKLYDFYFSLTDIVRKLLSFLLITNHIFGKHALPMRL